MKFQGIVSFRSSAPPSVRLRIPKAIFATMRHDYRKTHTYPRLNHTGWPKMVVVNFMATITILMH